LERKIGQLYAFSSRVREIQDMKEKHRRQNTRVGGHITEEYFLKTLCKVI
jgi:hypothetical protein